MSDIQDLEKSIIEVEETKDPIQIKEFLKEVSKSKIANFFTNIFLYSVSAVTLVFLSQYFFEYQFLLNDYKDIMFTLSTVLGIPLAFIMGYYYR